MTATYSKVKLSGCTDGKGIKVVATATPGTTIHTAVSGLTDMDEVWLYAQNNHTASVALTVQFGGTTSPDNEIIVTIPSKAGLYLVVPGFILNNANVIRAFAATTNVIIMYGWVNRITAG